jgi:hypothetical protein
MLSVDAERIGNSNAFLRPPPASASHWRRPTPCQRLPLAAAPPTRPARRARPVDAPRSWVERGAAQSGHAAQDGREEGQQGCPGAPVGKTAAAGVDPNTVLDWLMEAAEQLRALSRYCPCDVHVVPGAAGRALCRAHGRQERRTQQHARLLTRCDGRLSRFLTMARRETKLPGLFTELEGHQPVVTACV